MTAKTVRASAKNTAIEAASPQATHEAPHFEPTLNEVSNQQAQAPARTFHDLSLAPEILSVLDKLKFVTPTPIQLQAIPHGVKGDDIIGIAQTGTGKTLAFGLPIIDRFARKGKRGCGRSLIVLPTRELALQVEEALRPFAQQFGVRMTVLIGGAPMRPQQSSLRANPDILVVTPGRLIDHMQQRTVDLRAVDTLVLDEADRMLDMGFAPQIKQILNEVPAERQTLLFSATMPDQIVRIADDYMHHPVRVEIARAGTAADRVTQELFIVPQEDKNDLLTKLLYEYQGTVLVFARTRSRAARITRHVKKLGHTAAEIHADRSLVQRRAALDGFKNGTYRVLIATDIAARGIDVSNIQLVVNYDLPDNADDYVHRIGRTARAGADGHAVSFAAPDQGSDVRDIEKLLRSELEISEHSEHQLEPLRGGSGSRSRPRRGSGGSRSGGSSSGGYGGQGASRSAQPRSSQPRSTQQRSSQPRSAPSSRPRAEGAAESDASSRGDHSTGGTQSPYSNARFSGVRNMQRGRKFSAGNSASNSPSRNTPRSQ